MYLHSSQERDCRFVQNLAKTSSSAAVEENQLGMRCGLVYFLLLQLDTTGS